MADGDWSDIPREVILLDTLGQSDMTDTVTWDWNTIDKLAVTLDPLGQTDTAVNPYPWDNVVVDLGLGQTDIPWEYLGLVNGTLPIPLEYQTLPELNGITAGASILIVPLNDLNTPHEYWS